MDYIINVSPDGKPIDHPMSLENMLYLYPDLNMDALPNGMERFHRVSLAPVGPWEVLVSDEVAYERVNGVLMDTWQIRPMTDIERTEKLEYLRSLPVPEGFLLDEELGQFVRDFNQPGKAPDVIG